MAPVSPMNILAGLKLYGMNPTHAPTNAAKTIATSDSPSNNANTNIVVAEIVETPLARPSKPSIKFTEFVTATIHKTVNGIDKLPNIQYKLLENIFGLENA